MLTVFGFGSAICLQFLVRQIGPQPDARLHERQRLY
jgi:hypothetical protein